MAFKFKVLTDPADKKRYMLSLIGRQVTSIATLQDKFTDFAAYDGTTAGAITKLGEAQTILDSLEDKIIEALTAQAA